MTTGELLSTGEFARRAGVTVRTLRYYDRLGLLRPAARRHDGRRRYGTAELVRLQQILTLKFLGFSLTTIGEILDTPGLALGRALGLQRQQVEARIERLQRIARALGQAEEALARTGVDWESFAGIITAIQMEEQHEWVKEYYTEEQMAQFKARPWSPEQQAQAEADWNAIRDEARRLATTGADPAGDEAQALAARMQGMIDQFTQGDPDIEARLNRMYANRAQMPAQMPPFWDAETGAYMDKVLTVFRTRRAQEGQDTTS